MKNFVLGVLTGLLSLILFGAMYLRLGFAEVRGDLAPGKLETLLVWRSSVYIGVFARPGLPKIIDFPSGNQFTSTWSARPGSIGCAVPPLLEIK